MRAIRIHEQGGPEKLVLDDLPLPAPGAGEVRLRVEAAGLNFIDTYKRSGLYPVPLPHTVGQEAAGVVTAVGPGVTEFRPGDRVASASVAGACADEALAPAAQVVPVPAGVTSAQAAAVLLQGLTAHYLTTDTWPLRAGETALVHAAAGGVGLLLVQLAKRRGARVFATVGDDAKAVLAAGFIGRFRTAYGTGAAGSARGSRTHGCRWRRPTGRSRGGRSTQGSGRARRNRGWWRRR